MPDTAFDIIGIGVSTVDELVTLEHLPRANFKQGILSRKRQCGGLTGSALVAAARQGCSCAHAINLGTGDLSAYLRHGLREAGISLLESATPDAAVEPYYSLILIDRDSGERSILWDNSLSRPPVIDAALRDIILSAKCLIVDHVFAETQLDIVREARRAGVDVVGDFERTFPGTLEMLDMVNHLILPLGYCRQLLGDTVSAEEAARRLASVPGRSIACVTDGEKGSWYAAGASPAEVCFQPAFLMENVVDTTGCGDVFHGVYAAGLVQNRGTADTIRRAAAAAAMKTQSAGAQAGAPTTAGLENFLANQEKPR